VSWVVVVFVSLTFCALVGVTSDTNQKSTNRQVNTFVPKTLLINLDSMNMTEMSQTTGQVRAVIQPCNIAKLTTKKIYPIIIYLLQFGFKNRSRCKNCGLTVCARTAGKRSSCKDCCAMPGGLRGRLQSVDAFQTMNVTLKERTISRRQCLPLLSLSVIALLCKIKITLTCAMNVG